MNEPMSCETLLARLQAVLQPNESLRFTILPHHQGLALLLQPLLRKADNIPKEAEQARAMLSLPLRLAGTPAQLACELSRKLEGYAQARREVHDSYSALIDALNEGSKEAKAKTAQVGKSTSHKPKSPPPPAGASPAKAEGSPAAGSAPPASSSARAPDIGTMQPASLF